MHPRACSRITAAGRGLLRDKNRLARKRGLVRGRRHVRHTWLALAVLSLCFRGSVRGDDAVDRGLSSAERLTARLKKLQGKLELATGPNVTKKSWESARTSAHREMRDAITEFIKFELNSQHVSAKQLELDLKRSISASISNSWADQPAWVLERDASDELTLVVAFVLDEAAGGAMSVIQVYQATAGQFMLASQGGREMNDCDMHIVRVMPPDSGEIRLFAYGNIFGANQAVSKGVLYAIRDSRLIALWRTRDYLGLSAKAKEGRLTLEYQDPDLFYKRTPPDAYRDVYIQTANGAQRITHTPLPAGRQ